MMNVQAKPSLLMELSYRFCHPSGLSPILSFAKPVLLNHPPKAPVPVNSTGLKEALQDLHKMLPRKQKSLTALALVALSYFTAH